MNIFQFFRVCNKKLKTIGKIRRMRVAEFWRQVGAVTLNEDAATHSRPHACPLCTLPATVFFKVQKEYEKACETLIHMSSKTTRGRYCVAARRWSDKSKQHSGPGGWQPWTVLIFWLRRMLPPRRVSTAHSYRSTNDTRWLQGQPHLPSSEHSQMVGGYEGSSHQTDSVTHDLSLPLKQQQTPLRNCLLSQTWIHSRNWSPPCQVLHVWERVSSIWECVPICSWLY